jgi:hypothetical protein
VSHKTRQQRYARFLSADLRYGAHELYCCGQIRRSIWLCATECFAGHSSRPLVPEYYTNTNQPCMCNVP